jgi:hypothetical protein
MERTKTFYYKVLKSVSVVILKADRT